ncbi:TonB-dependent receptor family protein [Enterovirga aerilata]|uniref:TonB-dependent receptor n=1 Tax=Enterovirga aerilata TaxID=2730920 RepID=A0A849I8R5_9HYPH|nr:TonB-dependent receptor [Enterovirga sp. DB1703]NNM72685.1 TonB-dependent receptor [Enterovirga sp. DB1703]
MSFSPSGGARGASALSCLLWLAAPVGPAAAQDAPVALPEITVQGSGPPQGSLTVPSVEAQRDAVNATVGSVAFIDARSFENRYTNNITDVLRETPGVFAQTRYGQEIRLSIRGSGLARSFHTRGVEILQDGIPFNFADGSGDYYQIDPLALRSVEVFKGGNALVFGSSTLGGAVNFVTPTAYTALAPAFVRIEGGSFGAFRANAQVSGISGDADALLNVTHSHQDGFRRHQNQDYSQINANIGYRLAPGVETRFYLGIYETRQKLPGSLGLTDALTFPTRASLAAITGNQARDVSAQRLANRTSFELGGGKLDVDTWVLHKNLYHPIFQVIDQDGWTYGVSPHWSGSFDLAGHRNDLVVGARYFGGTNSALQFVNVAGNRGARTADARQIANNYQAFLDNRFWITPELAVMAGAKLFHDERDFENRFATPVRTAARDYDGFNPKLGLLWQPAPTVQVFADITRSRDVPDFSDLAQANLAGLTFVPLQQQKAWTGEIGTRGSWDRFRWDVTLYRSTVRDELINFSQNAALGIPAATFNADRTVHQGVELGGAVDLIRDLSGPGAGDTITLAQLWTWNDFRFVGDRVYGNNRIAGVPRHVLRTTLSYTRPDGFFIAPTLDWVPQGAFADHANTLRTPGYALFGIQAGAKLAPGLTVFVDARNLTDERYVSDLAAVADARTASTAIFYPGEGRSVFAGLRYAF